MTSPQLASSMYEPDPLTPSAERILRALAKGDATFGELRIRVRPMSETGIVRAMAELDLAGLVRLDERNDGTASLTDAGRERVG